MSDTLFAFITDLYIGSIVFLTTAYIYFKISVFSINRFYKKPSVIIIGTIVISVLYAFGYIISNPIAQTILDLYPCIFLVIFEKENILSKWMVCFFATCMNLALFIFSSLTVYFILSITNALFLKKYVIYFLYLLILAMAFVLLKLKRFRKGFQFFQDSKRTVVGITLAGLLFCLFCFIRFQKKPNELIGVMILTCASSLSLIIYFWIRRSITAHYRERLQLKSEEHYQALLSEKEQEIEKLNQSNEYLAKVVHRDNHLMSSLNSSIDAYFASGDSQFRDEMLRDIQTLAKERGELIAKELREAKILPSTGNLLIDGAINDLYTKAAAHGIDFSLTVSAPVGEVIGKFISQTDLQTLICDHIKDAMIAVDATREDKGKILVEFAMKNGSYSVTVFDSGIAFEPETLAKLGKERVTTHADNGGSGIGFMTTFETLRKAHASLTITEFETKTPFSKSVSFRFDGENTFTIQSYRNEVLREVLQREDIAIL